MEAKKFTYTYMEMLLFFICVYTIATLFNNKIPSIPLARIIGMFISAMMFIIMASQMTKKMFITFMLSVMSIIISFAVAGDYSTNFKDAVWFFTNWIRFTFRTQTETYSGYKLELSTKILFALYVWAPMLLNGMFAYQHYVYSCVLLSIYYYGFHENP